MIAIGEISIVWHRSKAYLIDYIIWYVINGFNFLELRDW